MYSSRRDFLATAAASAALLLVTPAHVLAANVPGVTDTEIRLKTTETDRHPLSEFKLQQFDGARWNLLTDS